LKRRFLKVLKSVEMSFEIIAFKKSEIKFAYCELQFKNSITVFQTLRQLETRLKFYFCKK